MKVPNVDLAVLYVMACYYCSEDLINELWEKLPKAQFYTYKHLCRRLGFHLVAYWNKRRENDLEGFFHDCIVSHSQEFRSGVYDPNQSVDVNMFRLAVRKGYVRAVKYFGRKLSREEKEKNVVYCLTTALKIYYEKHVSDFYRREQYTEISLYLSNCLTAETTKIVFKDLKIIHPLFGLRHDARYIDTFFCMFIYMWPWQECFRFVFNLIKNMVDKEQYKMLLACVIDAMEKNFNFGVPSESSASERQLHQLWNSIPTDWKASLGNSLNMKSLFLCNMSFAELILNDEEVIRGNDYLVKQFHRNYLFLVKNGKSDILLEFINKILISPKWDERVQIIIRTLYKHIMDGDFNSINNLLGSTSLEEVKDYKLMIDHELMGYYLLSKNEYEVADTFLKWKFNRIEQIQSFRYSIFLDNCYHDFNFTISHICNLWKTSKENVESAIRNSDKFLMWFLEEETEVMQFKIKHFVEKMFASRCFEWEFINRDHFEILEDFFYWCNLHENAFLQAKKNIIQFDLGNSMECCIKKNSIEEADRLLKWAFGDSEEERDVFMRRLLRQDPADKFMFKNKRIVRLCKLYLTKYWHTDIFSAKPTREHVAENLRKFINFFLIPYMEDFEYLRNKLKDWQEDSKNYVERIHEDAPSTDDLFNEYSEEEYYYQEYEKIYCQQENCELFLSLLNSATDNRI